MNFFHMSIGEYIFLGAVVWLIVRLLHYAHRFLTEPKVEADFHRNWGVIKDEDAPVD